MSWVKSLFYSHKPSLDIHKQHKTFVANGELYVPDKNKEGKSCLFIDCDLTFELGDSPNSYVIKINNLLYDPDQKNIEELIIKITPTLRFEKYRGHNIDGEEVRGFSFCDKDKGYLFQFLPGADQKADALEYYVTQLIFELKTGKSGKTIPKENLVKLCP